MGSHLTKCRRLAVLIGVGTCLVVGAYALGTSVWPFARWHLSQKPRLIGILQELQAPEIEGRSVQPLHESPHSLVHEGVRIGSSTPLEVEDGRVVGEGFSLVITPLQGDQSPQHQFRMALNALAITEGDVRSASGVAQRRTADLAVLLKGIILGGDDGPTHWKKALHIEHAVGSVLAWTRPNVAAGILLSKDRSRGRDFFLVKKGISPADSEDLISQLHLVFDDDEH